MSRTTVTLLAISSLFAAALACSNGPTTVPTPPPLPTPTPGQPGPTPTPVITAGEDGLRTLELYLSGPESVQSGTALVYEREPGVAINIDLRPVGPDPQGVIIKRGRCAAQGDWEESLEHLIGGISKTELAGIPFESIADGDHVVAVLHGRSGFKNVAACADIPDVRER